MKGIIAPGHPCCGCNSVASLQIELSFKPYYKAIRVRVLTVVVFATIATLLVFIA